MFLPGVGAISTARAGAAIASADDGEALALNPAGLAKSRGTTITISASLIRYYLEFTRTGTYDPIADDAQAYQGQPYATVKNDPDVPLGVGSLQPIPLVAIVSDLGGVVRGLHVGVGLYAPNAYPVRDMSNGYRFQTDAGADYSTAPPASRYDILKQESQLLLPTVAASYRIGRKVDIGARFSAGSAKAKSTLALWGTPLNVEEDVKDDTLFTADVKDSFVPMYGVGVNVRPTDHLELAAVYNSKGVIEGKGTGISINGPDVTLDGAPLTIGPRAPADVECAQGGTMAVQKACIALELPMSAAVAGRWKFLDDTGAEHADVEVDVGWEHWGKRCDYSVDNETGAFQGGDCTSPGQYLVVVDAAGYRNGEPSVPIQTSVVDLGLKDTYYARVGGSYQIGLDSGDPAAGRAVILRGGLGYDTRAAKDGFLRSNFDGAARTVTTVGASYRTPRIEVSAGGGVVLEGTTTNAGTCNPTAAMPKCTEGATGPNPTTPLQDADHQAENPIAQGTYKSHYLLFTLGFSATF